MAVHPFLAMTAAEIRGSSFLPPKIGWMACHFSPYSVGLSNLPKELPENSLLIVDDITPLCGHDPEVVISQLRDCVAALHCHGVLLDFQREDQEETAAMAAAIVDALACPAAVSEAYGQHLSCPVFLPPLPHHIPLKEWIKPWQGREIWLDAAVDTEQIQLTAAGASVLPLPHCYRDGGFSDEILHCHYDIQLTEDSARFILWRTKADVEALLTEAESMQITTAVGLYQEFQ